MQDDADDASGRTAQLLAEIEAEFSNIRMRRPEPEFDCQSIVSTYSNLENRPKLIAVPQKGQLIKLHPKTGMPMLPPPKPTPIAEIAEDGSQSDPDDDDEAAAAEVAPSVNAGKARAGLETPEERKARKVTAILKRIN